MGPAAKTDYSGRRALKLRLQLHNEGVADFVCNICGTENSFSGGPIERETPGCTRCGSSLRTRSLLWALSMELFGFPLTLPDFPRVKSWRGLGTSDSTQYSNRLAEVFDYRNTYYDRQPKLDLSAPPEDPETYDFITSSDVLEHAAPPHDLALRNCYSMLKPHGVLVFTVPYEIDEPAEHFPDLFEYGLAEVGDRIVLVNRSRAGELQIFENLNFHRSGAGKALEMRVFSEKMLRDTVAAAGFTTLRFYAENYAPFGIVPAESWSLPVAARKGSFACGIDAMRDVVEEWRDLKIAFKNERRLARSTWARIGRRLGLA